MQSLSTCRIVLNEVVQKLKKYSKEEQRNFEDAVGEHAQSIIFTNIPSHLHIATLCQLLLGCCGLEMICQRTAERFSASDYLAWLNKTHCDYRADLEEKLSVLDTLKYTGESLEHVCAVWRTEPSNHCNGFDFIALIQ